MSNNVVALLIVDSRESLPDTDEQTPLSQFSVVGLPLRRQALRDNSDDMTIVSEILYELGNPEHEEAGLRSVITQLDATNFNTLVTDDLDLMIATQWAAELRDYLKTHNKTLMLLPFST